MEINVNNLCILSLQIICERKDIDDIAFKFKNSELAKEGIVFRRVNINPLNKDDVDFLEKNFPDDLILIKPYKFVSETIIEAPDEETAKEDFANNSCDFAGNAKCDLML